MKRLIKECVSRILLEGGDYGYHAGDLGQSEFFTQFATSNRGTGHFGTGTYFVGNEDEINRGDYADRPHHKVDFSQYNLIKITDFKNGLAFHDALRDINNGLFQEYMHEGSVDEKKFTEACKVVAVFVFKGQIEDFSDLRDKTEIVKNRVIELYNDYRDEYKNVVNYGKSDRRSISTELISSFGYNGVDCRSCRDMDNTMFGSVIYNLEK